MDWLVPQRAGEHGPEACPLIPHPGRFPHCPRAVPATGPTPPRQGPGSVSSPGLPPGLLGVHCSEQAHRNCSSAKDKTSPVTGGAGCSSAANPLDPRPALQRGQTLPVVLDVLESDRPNFQLAPGGVTLGKISPHSSISFYVKLGKIKTIPGLPADSLRKQMQCISNDSINFGFCPLLLPSSSHRHVGSDIQHPPW